MSMTESAATAFDLPLSKRSKMTTASTVLSPETRSTDALSSRTETMKM